LTPLAKKLKNRLYFSPLQPLEYSVIQTHHIIKITSTKNQKTKNMKKSTSTFHPKTRYGAKTTNEGTFCTLHLQALDVQPLYAMEFKSVIFVVDLSGSMEDTLPHVKKSLLAFRSVLFPMETPKSREIAGKWRHNLNVVTFSETASHLWSAKSGKTFEEAVMSMETSRQPTKVLKS
jgi:hypothetical protein